MENENGEWRMGNGEWRMRMENGEWRMENGEWGNGEWGNVCFDFLLFSWRDGVSLFCFPLIFSAEN